MNEFNCNDCEMNETDECYCGEIEHCGFSFCRIETIKLGEPCQHHQDLIMSYGSIENWQKAGRPHQPMA